MADAITREELGLPWVAEQCDTDNLNWVEDDNGRAVCDLYIKTASGNFRRFDSLPALASAEGGAS